MASLAELGEISKAGVFHRAAMKVANSTPKAKRAAAHRAKVGDIASAQAAARASIGNKNFAAARSPMADTTGHGTLQAQAAKKKAAQAAKESDAARRLQHTGIPMRGDY